MGGSGSGAQHPQLSKVGALQSEVRHLGEALLDLNGTVAGLSSRMQAVETMMGEVHAAVVASAGGARDARDAGGEEDGAATGGLWEALSGSFKKNDDSGPESNANGGHRSVL